MLHDPDLLLYDEPTSGLDPESSFAVLDLIHEMAGEGRTIVMCTHLLLEAEGLADQVVVLEGGRDVISGPAAELTRRYWPDTVVRVATTDPTALLSLAGHEGVLGVELDGEGPALVRLDHLARVPDLVEALVAAGARVTRVEPFTPTLEDLYFAVRGLTTPRPSRAGEGRRMNWFRVRTIARTDLRQLAQARDFWGPMVILGSVFFVFVPLVLLLAITRVGDIQAVQQVSQALDLLPQEAQDAIRGTSDSARTSYAARGVPVRSGRRRRAAHDRNCRRRHDDRRRARARNR